MRVEPPNIIAFVLAYLPIMAFQNFYLQPISQILTYSITHISVVQMLNLSICPLDTVERTYYIDQLALTSRDFHFPRRNCFLERVLSPIMIWAHPEEQVLKISTLRKPNEAYLRQQTNTV